jgi:hypothetical protein
MYAAAAANTIIPAFTDLINNMQQPYPLPPNPTDYEGNYGRFEIAFDGTFLYCTYSGARLYWRLR